MAFTRAAKRPIQAFLSQKFCAKQPAHDFSSSALYSSGFCGYKVTYGHDDKCFVFLRRHSTSSPASEHMNLIRQLRDRTSAPIKDVKASLVACNWDIEDALKDLRKRGVALAAKKSARTASEGLLALAQDGRRAVIVELNCETDFVARNDVFQYMASSLAKIVLSANGFTERSGATFPIDAEFLESVSVNLDHPKLSAQTTVQGAITEVAAMVGENVKLRRGLMMSTSSNGVISSYLHACPHPGLGRIAGLLTLEVEDSNVSRERLEKAGHKLAMHVVASRPLFLSKYHVSSDALESEREIFRSQAKQSGKSEAAMEKMVEGRLKKYFEEVVFLEQKYAFDETINVKTVLDNLSNEVGSKVSIGNFIRMEIGEGAESVEIEETETAASSAAKC